jgi:hypothetical protein
MPGYAWYAPGMENPDCEIFSVILGSAAFSIYIDLK